MLASDVFRDVNRVGKRCFKEKLNGWLHRNRGVGVTHLVVWGRGYMGFSGPMVYRHAHIKGQAIVSVWVSTTKYGYVYLQSTTVYVPSSELGLSLSVYCGGSDLMIALGLYDV